MAKRKKRMIAISIELSDALTFRADVLALKYPQALYGINESVASCLPRDVEDIAVSLPLVGEFRFFDSHRQIG